MLTIGSLFSGIGGFELGLEWSGLGPVLWQVENNNYCVKVLEKHWPGVKRYKNVKEITGTVAPVDLICGGFPCQDVSAAGSGAGLAGTRSGLWYEFYRVVHELEPRWTLVENVASAASRWVDAVRECLELIGYETLPVPLSAFDVGAPHLRRRIFVIGRAVDTWSLRQWRSGGGHTITNSQRSTLRFESKRLPSRRPETVRGKGQTEPGDYGTPGDLAYSNHRRCQGKRFAESTGLESTSRGELDRCSHDRKFDDAPHLAYSGEFTERAGFCESREGGERWRRPGNGGCEVADDDSQGQQDIQGSDEKTRRTPGGAAYEAGWWNIEPSVGRVAHGVPRRVDRLRALGNAVVPQVAQVIGEIVKELTMKATTSSLED